MSGRKIVLAAATGLASFGYITYYSWKCRNELYGPFPIVRADSSTKPIPKLNIPTRFEQLKRLEEETEFDVLVIGGGATGAGVALDAVTRGLKTALVEKEDFSSGTSSRSTKLIHGGVRYLQKAVFNLDYEQYKLVREALHERHNLLDIAPHVSSPLPIMLPVYRWWQLPYFYVGIKMYDLLSGRNFLRSSYLLSKRHALESFPMLKQSKLVGAIVYYDGQHNDARMNIALALTAAREGATTANHVAVTELIKDASTGRVCGARMRDCLTGATWATRAKCVVNATGPFTDGIRLMDRPDATKICQPSAGVHVVLPDYYSPDSMGLLDPATSDGRVIFFLPWEGKTIAGTTDGPMEVTDRPLPSEGEIAFILEEIKHYLDPRIEVRRGDVLAAWSGIRPLIHDPNSKNTQSISRNHVIEVSDSGLVTIAGGKWTTYRSMAADTVDAAIKACNLNAAKPCQTVGFKLEGSDGFHDLLFIRLVQDFGLEVEVAKHLASTYGDKAPDVAKLAGLTGHRWPVVGRRLVDEFPYIEAEVAYSVKEYAETVVDVLARRTRLAFLNVQAADEAIPRIADIMGSELGWTKERKQREQAEAKAFLQGMGYAVRREIRNVPINFKLDEISKFRGVFKSFDINGDGHITTLEMRKALEWMGERVEEKQLRDLIAEVDINKNGTIEFDEFLQLMSCLKTGAIANNRLGVIIKNFEQKIPVDRSGGGL